MKVYFFSVLIFIVLSFSELFAQGESAVPFLLIHPGTNLNGMAGAFTALPTNDPFGQYYNPAQLGNFGREQNFAIQFYPNKTHWLPTFRYTKLSFLSKAIAVGYNFGNLFKIIPISVGIGYIDTELDLGRHFWADENGNSLGYFNSKESYAAYSFGMGVEYLVRFNIGYTFKKIDSRMGPHSAKSDAEDFGLQLTIPVINIAEFFHEKSISFADGSNPFFDISFGYALTNIGKKIKYSDSRHNDPIPKKAQLGYSLSFGLNKKYRDFDIRLVNFDWSTEANDILIKYYENYIDAPGDIKIWNNVILGKSDSQVSIHQGWRINLFETFQYSHGRFKGPGYPTFQKTSGYLFSTTGLFKWLSTNWDNNILKFIASHLGLSYMATRYTSLDPLNDTEFEGISISVFGL